MIQRPQPEEPEAADRDERLGEAIEAYLALAEGGHPPDPDAFAARYPDLGDDLRQALDGLALIRGLVGDPTGAGHRLESGHRIAGYRIVRELGRGGMGTVYEAVHVGLDRPVALKVLGSHVAPDSTGRRRFLNEARTAAGLHHTHIVPVFDVGQLGGLCYYAMQRIEGSGLDHVLRHLRRDRATAAGSSHGSAPPIRSSAPRTEGFGPGAETVLWTGLGHAEDGAEGLIGAGHGPDDPATPFEPPRGSAYYRWVADVGRQAAEALAHAHQRGIIHRDVKPSNLLVDARGMIWMADFGLARRLADPSLTQHDSLLGTPRYMSPEQARVGPIDGRSDIYSLGATLYELLTLRPPFEGRTAAELIEQITGREPAAPRQFDPRIPRDLETIVLKALAKRPADRYAAAADLADDLGRFLNFEPVRARRISPLGRLWRFARRHPSLTGVSTAAALIVVTVATGAYIRIVQERNQAIAAKVETQQALREIEAANRATRAAMGNQLWREASVVRLSDVPNRRVRGLGLLQEAADLGPDPALRTQLRNEAVEFLVLRDVEPRPAFATGPTRGLVFGPEGARLATLSGDGAEFRLWDVASRRPLERHALAVEPSPGRPGDGRPHGWGQGGIAALGSSVAVVLPDGRGLRLFDAATGAAQRDLSTPDRRFLAVSATPDGHRLVTVEAAAGAAHPTRREPLGAFQVNLWDPDHFDRPIATLVQGRAASPGRDFPLVAIAPDGRTVATAQGRQTAIALWSTRDGHTLGSIETQAELTALALGPDGLLAAAGGGAIRLWDIDSRAALPSLDPHHTIVRLMRFNPEGTLLAVAGTAADVEVWDPVAHTLVAVLPTPDRVDDLAFTPDGRTLAAAAATTSVWTVVDPVARVTLSGFDAPLTALAFRDNGRLAMGTLKGTIRTWRPGRCRMLTPASCPADPDGPPKDRPIVLTADGRGLIAVDPETIRFWPHPSRHSGLVRVSWDDSPGGRGKSFLPLIAWAAHDRRLFLARGARVLAWDARTPDRCRTLELPERPLPAPWRALATAPTGDRLYLIDHAGDVHALTLEGTGARWLDWEPPGEAASLAVSPDGAILAVGDRAGKVTLVDTADGTVRPLRTPSPSEADGRVWSLAFAPDGRTLALGTGQGLVELWSPDDRSAPLVRLPGHRAPVTTLAFDPKGHALATGGADKLVEVWDLERLRSELGKLGLSW